LTVDDAQERADRHLRAMIEPRAELLPAPLVHPDLTALVSLAVTNEDRATTWVEVALSQAQCL
jgi:uncharacterized protein (DUF4213/DUF364 family)